MPRIIDKRNFEISKTSTPKKNQLNELAAQKAQTFSAGEEIRIEEFDGTTGNPSVVSIKNALPIQNDYIKRALEYIRSISNVLGFAHNQPVEFVPDTSTAK